MASVPVIDLSLPEEVAAEKVRGACVDVGFFYVSNHGISDEVVQQQFAEIKKLFALPLDEKMKLLANSKNNRGYTPYQETTLDPAHQRVGDTKEGFYFGREVALDDPEADKQLHGLNQWPPTDLLPDFREVTTTYFYALEDLGQRLLRLLALSLGLDAEFFKPAFSQPLLFLRPLHYANYISDPDDGVFGAGAHTDYGMLTLLTTDGVPGLQVHLNNQWVDVPQLPGTFIINLGDMLERWTNGLYRSTLHRVVMRTPEERYSMPFFFDPNFDTMVSALPCCVSEDNPPRWPPVSAGEHMLGKYVETRRGFTVEPAAS